MAECLCRGCPNPQSDERGSLGRFCSTTCRSAYVADAPDVNTEALADAILQGGSE